MDQQRHYKSFFDAAVRIPSEEGLLGLWSGVTPTIARAMAANFAQLGISEEAKERFRHLMPNHPSIAWFCAILTAGSAAAVISLPLDNAKTKMQRMTLGPDGKMPYRNILDCIQKEVRANGITGLWVGLPPYTLRVAPNTMISLTVAEFLRNNLL